MSDSKGAAIEKELWDEIDQLVFEFAVGRQKSVPPHIRTLLIESEPTIKKLKQAILAILAQEVKRARIDENIHHKDNSDAVFHAIKNPTPEQRRIHEGLMEKFDNRIKDLERLG